MKSDDKRRSKLYVYFVVYLVVHGHIDTQLYALIKLEAVLVDNSHIRVDGGSSYIIKTK